MSDFNKKKEVLLMKVMAEKASELSDNKGEIAELERKLENARKKQENIIVELKEYKEYLPEGSESLLSRFLQLEKTLKNL